MNTQFIYQRGAATSVVIGAVVLALIAVGAGYYYTVQRSGSVERGDTMIEEDTMEREGASGDAMTVEKGEDSGMPASDSDPSMVEEHDVGGGEQDSMMQDETSVSPSYAGTMLAGSASAPLLEFNEQDYAKAVSSGDLVVLYFYADWCPICKEEFPKMEQAFDELAADNVVGFRVHFNDDAVTQAQEELAREFGVPYQHTKVFVRNGERLLKSPEGWEKNRYLQEIRGALN